MARCARRRADLRRFADFAIPWGVGLFLVLAVGEGYTGSSEALQALGQVLAVIQGAALRWRRRRPENVSSVLRKLGLRHRVQAVVLAYDVGLVRPRSS